MSAQHVVLGIMSVQGIMSAQHAVLGIMSAQHAVLGIMLTQHAVLGSLTYGTSQCKLTLAAPEVLKGRDLVQVGADRVTCAHLGVWVGPGGKRTKPQNY